MDSYGVLVLCCRCLIADGTKGFGIKMDSTSEAPLFSNLLG